MSKVELKNVSERVAQFLTDFPALRDNDARLVANIWLEDAVQYNPELDISKAKYFLSMVAKGVLSNTESIRRSRQLLQAKNPELRGLTYQERKNHSVNVKAEVLEIKNEIHNQSEINYGSESE
jgi:hypothetical protein